VSSEGQLIDPGHGRSAKRLGSMVEVEFSDDLLQSRPDAHEFRADFERTLWYRHAGGDPGAKAMQISIS